jgi:hypothetical protein
MMLAQSDLSTAPTMARRSVLAASARPSAINDANVTEPSSTASSSNTMTRCRSSNEFRMDAILANCARDETKMARASESRSMYWSWLAGRVAYRGTSTAPQARTARSATAHSMRFSDRIATRSRFAIPSDFNAHASALTRA